MAAGHVRIKDYKDISLNTMAKNIFLIIAGVILLNIVPAPVLSPIFIMIAGAALGILTISIFAPEDFNFLLKIFLIGFGIRVFLSFTFYILSFVMKDSFPGFLFQNDGRAYSEQGWQISEFAKRGIKITIETFMQDPNMKLKGSIISGNITPYDYFASHVYSITGYSPLSLFFISCLAGSLASLFVYLIAKELFSKNVARTSSFITFFWPSFILWSTQNLKEPMITMCICILLWSIFYIYRHPNPIFLLLSVISGWALVKISLPFAAIVFGAIFLTSVFLFLSHLFKNKLVSLLICVLSLSIGLFIFRKELSSILFRQDLYGIKNFNSMFEFLDYHRKSRAYGALKYFQHADISSLGGMLLFAPAGLFFAIFSPFPWQLGSFAQIIAVPETVLFYILIPTTIRGIIFAYKKRFNQSALLLCVIAAIMLFLGIIEGNSGTLFRHRTPAFYLFFIWVFSIFIFLVTANSQRSKLF
jgi:hypothetical protein